MAKGDKVLEEGDDLLKDSQDEFLRSVKASEKFIFDELIKIISVLSVTNGKLQSNKSTFNFLMSLDRRINDALTKADYKSTITDFLKNFDTLADNARAIQKEVNGLSVLKSDLKPIVSLEKTNVLNKLTALEKDFIAPIRENIYRNLYFGSDINSIEKTIKEYVVSTPEQESRLSRYLGQIATDSIHQFDGAIQQTIGEELGLNAIRYTGSLIKDSRGQCVKWVQNNGGIILVKNLEEEIKWAEAGGKYHGHKIGGMIPGTTPETFVVNRGGYRCRHRAFYTFVGKK